MADSGDHIIAYMGPLQLPSGAGYLTTNQRDEIMREFGVTAVVRTRQQWGCSALSLSGPVHQLAAARRRCMEMLQVEQLLDMNRSKAGPERQVLRQRTADMDARSHRSMEACMDRPSRRHAPKQQQGGKAHGKGDDRPAFAATSSSASATWAAASSHGWGWSWTPTWNYGCGWWQPHGGPPPGPPPVANPAWSAVPPAEPRTEARSGKWPPAKRPPVPPPGLRSEGGSRTARQPRSPETDDMEEVEVEDEDSSSSMTSPQNVPPRGKAAAPAQTRSNAAVACPAVPPSQPAAACPAAAPAVPAVACPAAAPEPGRCCPHTPPGYERVRDSEKCAARLQRVPARDTASTEPADAPAAAETEAATDPLPSAVSTTHEGAAQWLGHAAEDGIGEGAANATDEAAAAR